MVCDPALPSGGQALMQVYTRMLFILHYSYEEWQRGRGQVTRLERRGGTPQLSPAGEVSHSSPRGRDDTSPTASSWSGQTGTKHKNHRHVVHFFISVLFLLEKC